MKRSEINRYQQNAVSFFQQHSFHLPQWACWSPETWRTRGDECAEIKQCAMGWDITDFGSGEFEKIGLLLFTIRNGKLQNDVYRKVYAEKIMIVREGQITPIHFHWHKSEDIINRGGGKLRIQLWKSTVDEKLSQDPFTIHADGIAEDVKAGHVIMLNPGDSITIEPYTYHMFYAEEGQTLVGEISSVNDDTVDNRFLHPIGRFPAIEEDEPTLYPLFSEYP